MSHKHIAIRHKLPLFLLLGAMGLGLWGCASTAVGTDAGKPEASRTDASPTTPNQAEVWAQTCGHCHNLRSPGEFSYAQWEVIVHHMSVRANLTAADSRAILAFLKAAKSAPPVEVDANPASPEETKN